MPTSVRLETSLENRLNALSKNTGRSKAFYIKHALANQIEKLEYEYGIQKQVEDYRAGKLKTYNIDEVGELLGLED